MHLIQRRGVAVDQMDERRPVVLLPLLPVESRPSNLRVRLKDPHYIQSRDILRIPLLAVALRAFAVIISALERRLV